MTLNEKEKYYVLTILTDSFCTLNCLSDDHKTIESTKIFPLNTGGLQEQLSFNDNNKLFLDQLATFNESFRNASISVILSHEKYKDQLLQKKLNSLFSNDFRCKKISFLSIEEAISSSILVKREELNNSNVLVIEINEDSISFHAICLENGKYKYLPIQHPEKYKYNINDILNAIFLYIKERYDVLIDKEKWSYYQEILHKEYHYWIKSNRNSDHNHRLDRLTDFRFPAIQFSEVEEIANTVLVDYIKLDFLRKEPISLNLHKSRAEHSNTLLGEILIEYIQKSYPIKYVISDDKSFLENIVFGTYWLAQKKINIYKEFLMNINFGILSIERVTLDDFVFNQNQINQTSGFENFCSIEVTDNFISQPFTLQVNQKLLNSGYSLKEVVPNIDVDYVVSITEFKLIKFSFRIDGHLNLIATLTDTKGNFKNTIVTNLWMN